MNIFKRSSFRVVIPLLISLNLSACTSDNIDYRSGSADKSLSLVPQDTDGILVIGLHSPNFFSNRRKYIHTMEFRLFDPTKRRLMPEANGGRIIRLHRGSTLFDKEESAEKKRFRYLIQRLPSGSYFMTAVGWGQHGNALMSKGSFAVEIKPGRVNYVGNVRFKVPFLVFQSVKIIPAGREDSFVAEVMEKYKGVKAEIDHQKMSISKLNCNMTNGLQGCY